MVKSTIVNLILALAMAFSMMVFIGKLGRDNPQMDFDPRWVANAILGVIMVWCFLFYVEMQRTRVVWQQLTEFLTNTPVESPLFGTVKRGWSILNEAYREWAETQKGLDKLEQSDEPIP